MFTDNTYMVYRLRAQTKYQVKFLVHKVCTGIFREYLIGCCNAVI